MRWAVWILGGVALLALVGMTFFRFAPSDPNRWHLDPLTVDVQPGPGHVLMRPAGGDLDSAVYTREADALMAAFDRTALAEPRTTRLAGSVAERHVTYVVRSAFWGFPDYISVRAIAVDGGSQLAVFSRLRFGQSDLGVNRARLQRWLDALGPPGGGS